MKQRTEALPIICGLAGMVCLILDSHCAAHYGAAAIDLCLKTVIPNLFPMFVLSGIVISGIKGRFFLLKVLENAMKIPQGSGIIFLMGFLGGFPIGAQCITQAVSQGSLSKADAERMLALCNHCSPAFLFGIVGALFSAPVAAMSIWTIQFLSTVLLASLWPGGSDCTYVPPNRSGESSFSIFRSIRSMASVCAWIILASVCCGFLERWLFPFLPDSVQLMIRGLLEMTSGILSLKTIENPTICWLFCIIFSGFGGISVILQIHSICSPAGISIRQYISQKLTQTALSLLLGVLALRFHYSIPLVLCGIIWSAKIYVEKSRLTMYNQESKGGI